MERSRELRQQSWLEVMHCVQDDSLEAACLSRIVLFNFHLEIPAVHSQGADGEPSVVKIRKDDAGFHIKLWFEL